MAKYLTTKPESLESAVANALSMASLEETNKNNKSDDGEGLDAVQPKAVKKKFDDRKDKDIDNDGDTDSSDEFLHKKRKAISKSIAKKEGNAFTGALNDAKEKGEKTFVVSGKKYKVEDYQVDESADTEGTESLDEGNADYSSDDMQKSMIMQRYSSAISTMWGEAADKSDGKKKVMCEDCGKEAHEGACVEDKDGTTMTGQPMSKVDVNVKEKD